MATATKDMWGANLLEPWRGDSSGVSVIEFFVNTEEATGMGRLSSKDKVRPARLNSCGEPRGRFTRCNHS